jgi:CheY-like chemotaxis protein
MSKKKILLADDSITIQKVVELTFSEGEYEVVCVGNGAQAIRKIEEIVPDIALIDVMMPQRNGYEVCSHVKQNPDLAWIPVLLLTGTFEPFDPRRSEQVGAQGHITKPFESRALVAQVEELLGRHPRPRTAPSGREPAPIVPSPPPENTEVLNAGQILSGGNGPSASRHKEPAREIAEPVASPATVRIDSKALFAQAPGLKSDRAPSEEPPSALGPLDMPSEEEIVDPTHPVRVQRAAPEPKSAPSAPPPQAATAAAAASAGAADAAPTGEVARAIDAQIAALTRPLLQEAVERVVREIAWEIVPEIVESMVRRRIRELEEEVASSGGTGSR